MFHRMISDKAINCKNCQADLPNLLLDPAAPENAASCAHIATCASCANELAALKSTLSLLDGWQVPAISPYFNQKLAVRLREEQSAPPAGWFESVKTRLLLNTGRQFRPALAGALAMLLVAGGGIYTLPHSMFHPVQTSATVNDLKILDKNEQALQQVDQLLQDDAPTDTPAVPPES